MKEMYVCNSSALGEGPVGVERQEKIEQLRIIVNGTDALGQCVLGNLFGLGINNILYFDDSKRADRSRPWFLYGDDFKAGMQQNIAVLGALNDINPDVNIISRHGTFCEPLVGDFEPDAIIDTTNNPESKKAALHYALASYRTSIPFISCSATIHASKMTCYWPSNTSRRKIFPERPSLVDLLHEDMSGELQQVYPSGVVAGLCTEELRKMVFSYTDLDKRAKSNRVFAYNRLSSVRNSIDSDMRKDTLSQYRGKKVLIAGAGALGNWASAYVANLGIGHVDIVDFDIAETKNLNRQLQLRGRIGHKKATAVSQRHAAIDKHANVRPIENMLADSSADVPVVDRVSMAQEHYDVILGCLDNKYARQWLDAFSREFSIPYVDGGTHPREGQCAVYIPGVTKPIGEQLGLASWPEIKRVSCAEQKNPSVVMSNCIIASIMVGEMLNVFDYAFQKNPLKSRIQYDTQNDERLYVQYVRER